VRFKAIVGAALYGLAATKMYLTITGMAGKS